MQLIPQLVDYYWLMAALDFHTCLNSCLELLVDSLTLVMMYCLLLKSSILLYLFHSLVNAPQ